MTAQKDIVLQGLVMDIVDVSHSCQNYKHGRPNKIVSKWFQNECIIILRNLLLDVTIYGIRFLHDFLLSKRYEIQEKFDTLTHM